MIGSDPTGRTDVEIVATPDPLIVPVPRLVTPLVNATDPVTPAWSVAVIVTDEPYVLGPEVVTASVGEFFVTVCVSVAVEVLLLLSPLYVAVMVLLPVVKDDVASVATPLLRVDVPRTVDPLVNVTVPVTFEGSVSVKVTEAPAFEGLADEVSPDVGDAFETTCTTVPVPVLLLVSPP